MIIFGTGTLALQALEALQSNDNLVYGLLDDDNQMHNQSLMEVPVLGSTDDEGFTKLIGKKCDAFVALENLAFRKKVAEYLLETRKVMPVNVIHARAYWSKVSTMGHGNLLAAGVYVGPYAEMKNFNIIQPNAILESKVRIGNFVQIGSGSVLNEMVEVEDGAFIGAGVTIISGIKIGKNARVGAGSVVMANVKAGETVFGVPATTLKN